MKNTTSILIISLALTGCSLMQKNKQNGLIGVWQSNEQKTLDSMEKTKGVTKKAKAIFKNGFFGKIQIKYTNDMYQTRFPEEKGLEELEKFYPYKLLENTDEFYLTESYEPTLEQNETEKLYKDGNCYYILVSKWKFREYFCKIK